MKKIFIVDWILIFISVLSVFSGIELHIAGHGTDHETWHNWAVFHVIVSFLFLIFAMFHVKMHWNWYVGVIRSGVARKSKVTAALSLIFVFTVFLGIILLGIDGANSNIGLWHYRIGLILTVFSLIHIFKRFPILVKSLNRG